MPKAKVSYKRLREVLEYSPDIGIFTWILARRHVTVGSVAGSKKIGCIYICVDKRLYKAHRLAWLYSYKEWPARSIDHINGNGTDNRLCNLRLATMSQNIANSKRRINNKSGFKGTWLHKASGLYAAQVTVNYTPHHLGYFKTPEEAHAAYCEAAEKHFGEFARRE